MVSPASANRMVVDASVATKWHLKDEDHVVIAAEVLTDLVAGCLDLVAPTHLQYEVASALVVASNRSRVSEEQGRRALVYFLSLPVKLDGSAEFVRDANPLARQFGLPLVLADDPFYRKIRSLPSVVWIEDYGK